MPGIQCEVQLGCIFSLCAIKFKPTVLNQSYEGQDKILWQLTPEWGAVGASFHAVHRERTALPDVYVERVSSRLSDGFYLEGAIPARRTVCWILCASVCRSVCSLIEGRLWRARGPILLTWQPQPGTGLLQRQGLGECCLFEGRRGEEHLRSWSAPGPH